MNTEDTFKEVCEELNGEVDFISKAKTRVCILKDSKMGITEEGVILPVK